MTEEEIAEFLKANPAAAARVVGQLSFASPWQTEAIDGDEYHTRIVIVPGLGWYEATVNPPDDGEVCENCGHRAVGRHLWNYDIDAVKSVPGGPSGPARIRAEGNYSTAEEAKAAVDAILRSRGVSLA